MFSTPLRMSDARQLVSSDAFKNRNCTVILSDKFPLSLPAAIPSYVCVGGVWVCVLSV